MSVFKRIASLGRIAGHVRHMAALRDESACRCLGWYLERNARLRPEAIAIKFGDLRYTWAQFNAEANRVAAGFSAHGVQAGDCVALLLENSPQALFLLAGLNKVGIISSLLNCQLSGEALVHVMRSGSPRMVVADAEFIATAKAAIAVLAGEGGTIRLLCSESGSDVVPDFTTLLPDSAANPTGTASQRADAVMMYLYTSGTTGLPKAAIIRNQRFLTMAHLFAGVISKISADDVIYLTLPIYHATGAIGGFGSATVGGAAIALRRKFSASEFWSDCVRYEATVFNYIGEICRYLMAAPAHPLERAHRLRAALGAGMRSDIWSDFQARFNVPRIVEFYGATEGNIGLINLENKPGMMGRLLPGQCLVRIDDESEAFLRNDRGYLIKAGKGEKGILLGRITQTTRFDGYLDSTRNSDKILRDPFGNGSDYFNSGDLAQLHAGRWVSFADRLGDTYRWKGENISTVEVSNLLNACSGIIESTVYGVEVPGCDGRAGMAVLVIKPDFDISTFSAQVQQQLPVHLRPVFLRIKIELATTASFKYVKTQLQKEGFCPRTLTDALYVFDINEKLYVALDGKRFDAIGSGTIRL